MGGQGSGFRHQASGFRAENSGFMVWGSGSRVGGSGFGGEARHVGVHVLTL